MQPQPRNSQPLYHYKKSRRQQARLFIRMGVFCWLYVAALFGYEAYAQQTLPEDLRLAMLMAFPLASGVLFLIAWWLIAHPADYEATITRDQFEVRYPGSEHWSFSVSVADIKRFESRQTLSHAGPGIMEQGIVLKDGRFFHISMNYGNHIGDMYKAVKSVNPEVTYPARVNRKAQGLGINKDYDA
ncbi:MAG: hypothetical protein VYA55_07535 [Pseudomonadota bacterium]|nr:hypothetical protein [Pseudomonadota bacterium]